MTNQMIIMSEQERLFEEGILQKTGRIIKGYNPLLGEEVEYEEIQPIHTYQAWKAMGYQVRKGEKAVAKFPVWKYTQKKKESGEEESHMFMKTAAFFTNAQVDKIEKKIK